LTRKVGRYTCRICDCGHEGACSFSPCDCFLLICYMCRTRSETSTKYGFVFVTLHKIRRFILSGDRVTVEGVWIGNRIYCTLKHTTRDYTLQITVTHRLVFSVTVFTALLDNGFQQWTFLCFRAHVLAGWRPSHTNLLLF
jgi:hypothetical protein